MDVVFSFLVTVMGGVICHLIVKWLDRNDKATNSLGGCLATEKR